MLCIVLGVGTLTPTKDDAMPNLRHVPLVRAGNTIIIIIIICSAPHYAVYWVGNIAQQADQTLPILVTLFITVILLLLQHAAAAACCCCCLLLLLLAVCSRD